MAPPTSVLEITTMTKRKSTQADMPALPIAIEQATPAKPKAKQATKAQIEQAAKALEQKQAEQAEQIKLAAEQAAREFTRAKAGEGEKAIYKGAETRGEDSKCQLAPAADWDNPRARACKFAGFSAVAGKLPTDWVPVKVMADLYVSLGQFNSRHSFDQGLNRLIRGGSLQRNQGMLRVNPYIVQRATEDTEAGLNPYHKA